MSEGMTADLAFRTGAFIGALMRAGFLATPDTDADGNYTNRLTVDLREYGPIVITTELPDESTSDDEAIPAEDQVEYIDVEGVEYSRADLEAGNFVQRRTRKEDEDDVRDDDRSE